MENSDKNLIEKYLSGDDTSLATLINTHLSDVFNFVFRLSGSHHDAEDIAQETFLKAWKNLRKFKPEENFRAWLFTIARNCAIDHIRKRKTIVFSHFEDDEGENHFVESLADPEPLPPEIFARAEEKEYVEKILSKLSPLYREVLLLRYSEHFTFDEIGAILKKPLDTVKSQHRRALIEMKKLME